MKKATPVVDTSTERKGHVCPPSDATHPRDRWETLFVYSFICKFTQLRTKVEGLESPMDFEEALLAQGPHPIMVQVVTRFILNLRPQTRNISTDQLSDTVSAVFSDYMKTTERSVFWDDEQKKNINPFRTMEQGLFHADWDMKLKILRQLVELQLSHGPEIKKTIDNAWGIVHNKHRKKEVPDPPPLDPSDPNSMESLQFVPIGQDNARKRYWVVDASPRVYVSTNPWKITATINAVSNTREDYVALLEKIRASAPADIDDKSKKLTKSDTHHALLMKALEDRLEVIDNETLRIQKQRKKAEQRNMLMAQAELRQTRTRRQTRRPDYVYDEDPEEDDADEDMYQQEEEPYDEEPMEDADFGNHSDTPSASTSAQAAGKRRSTRTNASSAAASSSGRRSGGGDEWTAWKGERRSSRLGAPPETQMDEPPVKRARTEESTASAPSVNGSAARNGSREPSAPKFTATGAAAVKPTETAVEQLAGRKKSKFWFYAVEPIAPPSGHQSVQSDAMDVDQEPSNGHRNGGGKGRNGTRRNSRHVLDGSLSPAPSMEE